MLEQIAGAQAALEYDIELLRHAAAVTGDGAALAVAQNQISRLSGLLHRVESAHGGGLAAIRAEVVASVIASQTIAQQARSSGVTAQAAEAALHAASAEAHRLTGDFVRDFYERKIFDPYLVFGSPEEERAYREREAARLLAIESARAEGTPEGELRATRLALAQLNDAKDFGADQSPEFAATRDALTLAEQSLAARMPQPAQTHEEQAQIGLEIAPVPPVDLPPELLASLRTHGVVVPDQNQSGHGITGSSQRDHRVGLA